MKEQLTLLMRYLKIYFWTIFLTSTAIGIFLILFAPNLVIDPMIGARIESIAIFSLLGLIPLALWLYNKKIISATLPEDKNKQNTLIFKWFVIRFILIDSAFIFNLCVYSLTKNSSLLYGIGIAFMILLFLCKPNKKEISELIN